MSIKFSPSILSADFTNISKAVAQIDSVGADMIHCDVMDGMFVSNISFGSKMVNDINKLTNTTLDVHLMIVDPIRYIAEFIKSGADIVTVHLEACEDVAKTLLFIRNSGAKVGLSIKPNTPVSAILPYVKYIDLLLIMSVEPGFGGQKFIENSLNKIAQAKAVLPSNVILQVDGGVNFANVSQLIAAGATCIVAGSAFFNAEDKATAARILCGDAI